MTTTERRHSHRLARSISWLMLGLTLVAFAGAVVLQWLGCGILFDSSRAGAGDSLWSGHDSSERAGLCAAGHADHHLSPRQPLWLAGQPVRHRADVDEFRQRLRPVRFRGQGGAGRRRVCRLAQQRPDQCHLYVVGVDAMAVPRWPFPDRALAPRRTGWDSSRACVHCSKGDLARAAAGGYAGTAVDRQPGQPAHPIPALAGRAR